MKLAAVALAVVACSREQPPPPQPEPAGHAAAVATDPHPSKDPAKARQLIAAGNAVVLDVRTAEEFGDGHLPAATNLPVDDLPQHLGDVDKLAGGDKAKPIVVYCQAGSRAAKAKRTLEAAGYTNVTNGGGLDDLR
ncbi:MAG TPA: rhodanese-like domain-containing protein [Kofleriaceae bacterium]|nr:rhodanese-like domain-containing protein [Kofleriaceae bacterium]